MTPRGRRILDHLLSVDAERELRASDPALRARVAAVKAYQQARFLKTYADVLLDPRYAVAAQFFLDELYGPVDFSQRDAQFARIVPALTRLFPDEMIGAVERLAELHSLSEVLDSSMGRHIAQLPIVRGTYLDAWQAVGREDDRARQIGLTAELGEELAHLTRSTVLRVSLRMMRGPARASGLGALQDFLERGFDTFRSMEEPGAFLSIVEDRERRLADRLFHAAPAEVAASSINPGDPLHDLPDSTSAEVDDGFRC